MLSQGENAEAAAAVAAVTGRLSAIVTDNHEVSYAVETDGQFVRLQTDQLPEFDGTSYDWRGGADTNVRVFGELGDDGSVVASKIEPADTSEGVHVIKSGLVSGQRKALFIRVTFDGGQPSTSADNVRSKAADLASRFNTASFGALSYSYDVVGPYNLTFGQCGDIWRWASDAKNIASQNGINVGQYNNVSLIVPANCGWGGLGEQPGSITWIAAVDVGAIMHEFGHNFGNYHSGNLTCTSNGQRVTMSDSCNRDEYGDPFDCMGNTYSARQFNAELKAQLGWIPSSRVATASVGQTYTLAPSNVATSSGLQLLNVNGANGVVYGVEFRQPATADNFSSNDAATKGVSVRVRYTQAGDSGRTQIIDMTPSTGSWDDSPLAAGKSHTFYGTSTTMEVVSTSAAGAVLKVTGSGGGNTGGGSTGIGTAARSLKVASSGKCLSLAGNDKTLNGANAVQRTCSSASDQIWTPVPQTDGTVLLQNKASGKCLDVYDFNVNDGARIAQWDCWGGNNQRWKFVAAANGSFTMVSALSNKCLDVFNNSSAENAQIGQWSCHGDANQRFTPQ